MRLSSIVVAVVATCMVKPWVSAADADTSATRASAYLPPCAAKCLAVVIPESACTATDSDCICNNQALTESTTACLVSNCTVKEALSTAKYQQDTCNAPVRDQTDLIAKVNYPLQFIAAFTVVFRIFARSQWGQGAGFWWDDWFLLVGFCLFTAGTGVTLRMGAIGLGKDMWEVPYDNITRILLHFFIDELLYIGVLSATKLSIIFLYLRMASNAHTFAQPSPESTDLSELEKARQGSGNGQDHDHDDDSASTASDSTFSERHMEGPQSLRGVPTTLSRTTSRRLEQTGTATSTALSRIRSRPARQSFTHPLANEKTNQDVLVDFDGPDDPYRPLNWPFRKKAITTVLYGFTTMGATFASSVYSPALEQVSSDFGVGREVSVLGLALLLFGFGLGPLVWAPLSEVYGRKPAVLIPTFVSAIFAFGGGAAKDIQTILICRFFQGLFGSAPVTNTGGVLGDIWSAEQRGAAIVGYAMAVVGGPTLGPIVGGAICMSYLRWRWTQYITGIFQMFILVLDIIVLDESYPAALLVSKAQRLRHQTGNWALHAKHEEWDVSLNELANKYLVRPFQLLMTPICFLVALYASFVYGILYASLAAFPIEFEEARGWNKVVGALPFLAMLLGVIIGAGANLFNQKFYIKRWKANNCRPVPEARLPPMMAGSLFFVAGLFMFAWTSSPSIHWIAPCIGIVLLGCGFFTIFQAALNYLIDTFQRYAASAVAANTFLRSAFAGAFPIFIAPMLHNIGIDWGISVFAFVACLLVPIPYLFYIYGKRIRARGFWSKESVTD
ncbi:MFS general substrate transporter [Hortaea werneckii]|uniref:Cercosporin MFS transporter CTB4 n=2 Tax=Hortaea werneckii TaxID=91943 RepID=A0A1Z5TUU1_HORWE|nr:MFS general substrate transporter [Hortaea werneckii]OTA39792.1 hypothetical protein BTJ68_00005 [Hortaea werneckii EXF-2000]KAI6816985.1 MFS general substrate transporter [Hortaea werneckii]KAI6938426.1 MFS general substrate transporter [Hortaea werneckii]KAI6939265.1 MFS general substrate transporter [Hortaea werneckii]